MVGWQNGLMCQTQVSIPQEWEFEAILGPDLHEIIVLSQKIVNCRLAELWQLFSLGDTFNFSHFKNHIKFH